MRKDEARLLKNLLTQPSVLSLGVLVEGEPYVGLLPFMVSDDYRELLVHASGLALHTRGLSPGASFSALIHAGEHPGADPLQLPRVTLQGRVRVPEKGTEEYRQASELYQSKFPQSAQTFFLGDFHLYLLQIVRGRLVAGFGRTVNINEEHLAGLRDLQDR